MFFFSMNKNSVINFICIINYSSNPEYSVKVLLCRFTIQLHYFGILGQFHLYAQGYECPFPLNYRLLQKSAINCSTDTWCLFIPCIKKT